MEIRHAKIQLSCSLLFPNLNWQTFFSWVIHFFYFLGRKKEGPLGKKGLLAYELMRLPHIYSAPQFVLINLLLIFQTCEPTIVLDGWRKQGT
jgi:hypothetical protein